QNALPESLLSRLLAGKRTIRNGWWLCKETLDCDAGGDDRGIRFGWFRSPENEFLRRKFLANYRLGQFVPRPPSPASGNQRTANPPGLCPLVAKPWLAVIRSWQPETYPLRTSRLEKCPCAAFASATAVASGATTWTRPCSWHATGASITSRSNTWLS